MLGVGNPRRKVAMLEFSHQIKGGICIVSAEGSLIVQEKRFRTYVESLLKKKEFEILVLDFEKIGAIDSTGLAVLVVIYKKCLIQKIRFILSNLNERNIRLLRMTKLDQMFHICQTEEEIRKLCNE
jgi:anti-anti-sigma factor